MKRSSDPSPLAGWVAIILAVGISTAVNAICFGVLYTAVFGKSDVSGGLSENATQVLTAAFGGMVGVLGAYVGFKAGASNGRNNGTSSSSS